MMREPLWMGLRTQATILSVLPWYDQGMRTYCCVGFLAWETTQLPTPTHP